MSKWSRAWAAFRAAWRGQPAAGPARPKTPPEADTGRGEALTLLAVLQREARLVDFLKESLDGYTDAQIGAAVRPIHADCAAALERIFALRPLSEKGEGETVVTPVRVSPNAFSLTGRVSGEPPYTGKVVHPGWKAERCELPTWSGPRAEALLIAPIEIEVG